jgi:AcrR family transcriptional regulator
MKKDDMTETGSTPAETARGETRRAQVLDAATECFMRHGFHGASIAEISKTAGMSVGHIYHYFENKDAIIAAIVERDLQNTLAITRDLLEKSQGRDVLETMIEDVDEGVDQCIYRPDAALMLEVVVEAARNPKIAEIVRRADDMAQAQFRSIIVAGHKARNRNLSVAEIDGQLEAISALFEGLTIRYVRRPTLDRATIVEATRRALRKILDV